MRNVSSVLVLFAFWLLLSGFFTVFLVSMGFLTALGVVWLAYRMDVVDHEGHPIHLGPGVLTYWPWLGKEIVKSGWDVTKVILNPRLPVSPALLRFRPTQHTDVGLATHANSITLTPGTLSVDVGRAEFLVHAVTEAGAEVIRGGEMDRRVTRFEGA